jgi:O-methyltransferase
MPVISPFLQRAVDSRWTWFLKGLPVLPRAAAMFRAKRYTMTTPVRCRSLWDSCRSVLEANVPGCFVECGVWKGGSSAIMAMAIKNARQERHLHLFDSFEGLPEPTEKDGKSAAIYSDGRNQGKLATINQCQAGLDEVCHLILDEIKVRNDLAHFHVGWFQNTIPADAGQLGPIALLRLDGDWYDSTKICLEHLYPLLSPGGIIIMDDYWAWEGCRKATDEYRNQNNIDSPIQRIDGDAGFWVKTQRT